MKQHCFHVSFQFPSWASAVHTLEQAKWFACRPCLSHLSPGKRPAPSVPPFSHLKNGHSDFGLMGGLWGLNEMTQGACWKPAAPVTRLLTKCSLFPGGGSCPPAWHLSHLPLTILCPCNSFCPACYQNGLPDGGGIVNFLSSKESGHIGCINPQPLLGGQAPQLDSTLSLPTLSLSLHCVTPSSKSSLQSLRHRMVHSSSCLYSWPSSSTPKCLRVPTQNVHKQSLNSSLEAFWVPQTIAGLLKTSLMVSETSFVFVCERCCPWGWQLHETGSVAHLF